MALSADLIGQTFSTGHPYVVTADKVAEFAAATQTPYQPGDVPPATFPIVVAFPAIMALLEDEQVGLDLARIVHGEQRFTYTRPIQIGDELSATLQVDRVRSMAGSDIITTTSRITDAAGELVCDAKATLIHRGEDA